MSTLTTNAPGVQRVAKALRISPNLKRCNGETCAVQNRGHFVNFVAQHDVIWKVDKPLDGVDSRTCMYLHPASQSMCKDFNTIGDPFAANCFKWGENGFGYKRRCAAYGMCFQFEHNFRWGGQTDMFVARPMLRDTLAVREMRKFTGHTKYVPGGMDSLHEAWNNRTRHLINERFAFDRSLLRDKLYEFELQSNVGRPDPAFGGVVGAWACSSWAA